ncbi:hypothetical protein ABZ917_25980 [Nonomuraea wenchangensis]
MVRRERPAPASVSRGCGWWRYFPTPDRHVNHDRHRCPERWRRYVEFTHRQIAEIARSAQPGSWWSPRRPLKGGSFGVLKGDRAVAFKQKAANFRDK